MVANYIWKMLMADTNEKDESQKPNSNPEEDKIQSVIAPLAMISMPINNSEKTVVNDAVAEDADMDDDDDVDDDVDEEEYEEEEEEDESEPEDEEKDEKVNNAIKEDEKKPEETKTVEELAENAKNKGKNPRPRNKNKKNDTQKPSTISTTNGDKPESSTKKKAPKRVESMGMVFMCTSKTKTDCFRYNVLGLPGNKKDQVAKIYKGMRLFLFDVDLRLMYGIFKAAGPGGYNLEPKAFKSDFPSQVRFTVLEDCIPLAEENFKDVLKENYYSRNKFEGLLKAEQVRKLCKLFVDMGRGRSGARPKPGVKPRRTRPVDRARPIERTRPVETRRTRPDDSHASRPREKRRRPAREEQRRPRSRSRSPPHREKRRYTDYDYEHEHERPPVIYHREPPVTRYLPPPLPPHRPPPTAIASPVRLYAYERPLDIPPPYIHDRVPEHHHTYRVLDVEQRDRDRDHRDPYARPTYREPVYTLPPEYQLVSREYNPPVIQAPEYHLSGGSRVPSYRDIGLASDYRTPAASLPEYRSRTHYRY